MRENVGGYRLFNRIGLGAHGIVYHAENVSTRQHVALKVLTVPKGEDAQETHERFIREAETLSRLQHPNIIRYEGSGVLVWQQFQLPFLATEFVEDLQTLDGAAPGRPGEWTLDRIDELLAALAYLHSQPMVHRGLRPTSLGVGKDNVLRVLDLGVVRVQNSRITAHS
ncbi:MAG: protein kinase domain-containing protein, partial [Candidatus Xenobia bacterium]